MIKQEVLNLLSDQGFTSDDFSDFYTFLSWLYDNGLHVAKGHSEPPKSKFMEEWGNLKVKPSEVFNGVGIWDVLKDLVKLIDNHKADK